MRSTYYYFLRIVLVIFVFSTFVIAQNEERLLEFEKPISRELSGGEVNTYRITLPAQQFLHILTEQKGIDVVVILFAPDGKKLFEIDSPNGNRGNEPLWFVSEAEGNYRLEIGSLEKNAPAGKYEVIIKELHAAKADDNFFVAGKKAIAEGILLQVENKEESRLKQMKNLSRQHVFSVK